MKNRSRATLALKMAAFYFTLAGVCQTALAQSEIHFRLVQNALIVVPVMVGNEGPFDFILDTGANTVIVDPSVATHVAMVAIDNCTANHISWDSDIDARSFAQLIRRCHARRER